MSSRTPTYDAFISYSHAADNRLAPALQSGLERMGRPWYRLRGLNIFRDQTNLSAQPDLWASIERSLSASTWFLLLGSPNAAASKWVMRELQWWLAHRESSRVLIVLTDGDLTWSDEIGGFDPEASSGIPSVLMRAFAREPSYVDMRWAKDGKDVNWGSVRFRSALLDVAATILGRSKEEVDGDAVRVLRRNRIWALSAIISLTLAGGWAIFAWQKALHEVTRNEAVAMARQASALTLTKRQSEALPLAIEAAGSALFSLGYTPLPVLAALRDTIESSREHKRWDAGEQVDAVLYDPADSRLLTFQHGGHVRKWNESNEPAHTIVDMAIADHERESAFSLPSPSGGAILARLGDNRWRVFSLQGQPLPHGRDFISRAIDVVPLRHTIYIVNEMRYLQKFTSDQSSGKVVGSRLPAGARRLMVDTHERWVVVIYEDDQIELIHLPSGLRQALGRFCAEGSNMTQSGDSLLVVGCGQMALIPLPKGEPKRQDHPALALIEELSVCDDGLFAVSHKNDDRVHVFTLGGSLLLPPQLGVEQPHMAFSRDCRRLALAGNLDSIVTLVDLRDRGSVFPFGRKSMGMATSLDTCRDRTEVFWGTQSGSLYSFDSRALHLGIKNWGNGTELIERVQCLAGRGVVAEYRDHSIRHWGSPGQSTWLRRANEDSPEGLATMHKTNTVVALERDTIRRWDQRAGSAWRELPSIPLIKPDAGWRTLLVDQQDGTLALGSTHGDLLLLELATGKPKFGPAKTYLSDIWMLAASSNSDGFAAGGAGTPLSFFDWSGRQIGSLKSDRFLFASAFAYDSKRRLVVMPGYSGELPLKDIDGNEVGPPIRPIAPVSVTPMQFNIDGKLITADWESGIGIHELAPDRLFLLACQILRDQRVFQFTSESPQVHRALQSCERMDNQHEGSLNN